MAPNPLRSIPSVNELLENPRLRKLVDRLSPGAVVSGVRAVLEEVRNEVQTAASEMTLPSVSELAERIARRVLETERPGLEPVVNATGVLLCSQLGSPPLAIEAIAAMTALAGEYASIHLDLATGQACRRGQAVEALLTELSGAEAALVTNSKAGATVLAVAALAAGREMIISRGHLVATEPDCRLAELVAAGGATLREVGAANFARADDYQKAIGDRSAALMLVHPSRSATVGFAQSVALEELVELGRRHGLPVVHDIGLGGLVTIEGIGPPDQPDAAASIQSDADVVILAGDQLLGGPSCGIVVGRRALVRAMAEHPTHAAFAADKLNLAALAATLQLWQEPDKARRAIPLLGLLGTSVENLQNRAERLAPQIAATEAVATAEVVAATTHLAGAAIASHAMPTRRIAIKRSGMNAQRLAAILRLGSPSVVALVEADQLLVDLCSVIPRQDRALVEAFAAIGGVKP